MNSVSFAAVADRRAPGMLGRRAQQIVQQPLDGPEVRAALESLASCYGGGIDADLNGLARHRDVRGDMQARSSQMDAEFVQALGAVEAAFAGLERSVDDLDGQCAALRTQVNAALRTTAAAAAQAAALADERRELAARLALAGDFLARFSLADADARALGGAVGPEFFAALDRVGRQRAECQKLGGGSQAAHEMARELGAAEDAAFAALARWAEGRARDAPDEALRRALRRLRAHPVLLDAAAAAVARARREAVGRAFQAAVAGGARPIDAHAGDAARYVGDLLAWAHVASAEEAELLDGAHVGVALEAVARPLEQRVAAALAEARAPAVLFRIDGVLAFYAALFAWLPADSAFAASVRALGELSRARLAAALDALVADAVAFDRVPPALEPPPAFGALVAVVADILRVADGSLGSPESPVAEHVARALDRLRAEAAAAAAEDAGLRGYERTVFALNVLAPLLDAARGHACLARWHAAQAADYARLGDALCAQLVAELKGRSRLPFGGADALEERLPPGDAGALEERLAHFNRCLSSSADLDVARLVARLADHALARATVLRVTEGFVEEYGHLYNRIGKLGESAAVAALLLPPDTVATLL
ncbi:Golgi transport complex subunit 6 [Coemansia sp. RSA 2671]|nr:Golgi transport complex subunit 6 [Coemansia sp. RSA 2675]KAJ2350237.1 Golgi transport complex subunit 6 [Coemansia sp. RSA 2671]